MLHERPADDYYDVIAGYGIDPAFMLAVFGHESQYGTKSGSIVQTYDTKNWGNTRTLVANVPAGYVQTPRGQFVRFTNWLDGLRDACERLFAPNMPYAKVGARTVETIIPIWAPAGDYDNSPSGYMNDVLAKMRAWAEPVPQEGKGVEVLKYFLPDGVNHWNGRAGNPVKALAIHVAEGSREGVRSWFNNPSAQVSAHYLVNKDGSIWQFVDDGDTAWANGPINQPNMANPVVANIVNSGVNPNRVTISIETERTWRERLTEPQMLALGALAGELCHRHGIPIDENHLLGHYELDAVNRPNCPGLTRDEWVRLVRLATGSQPAQPAAPATTDAGFPSAIQQDGRTVLNGVDFGGTAVSAERVTVQVRNAAGERYTRTWDGHQLGPWERL